MFEMCRPFPKKREYTKTIMHVLARVSGEIITI